MSLYGNIGSNLDERNWAQILASPDPLLASEEAQAAMLRDPAYLLRNANNLLQRGYTDNQVSYTYQPLAQLLPQVVADHRVSLPPPTLAFSGTDTGFLALLSEAGE